MVAPTGMPWGPAPTWIAPAPWCRISGVTRSSTGKRNTGARLHAIYGANMSTGASWNAGSSKEAEKTALDNCKRQLKALGVKAKCVVAGSGYNGTGWVAWGIRSRLFFGLGEEEALAGCRDAGAEECSIYARFITDGTDASGLEYLEGVNAAEATPADR